MAIRGATLERSIERSQLLARAAEARLLRTQRRAAAGIKSKVSARLPTSLCDVASLPMTARARWPLTLQSVCLSLTTGGHRMWTAPAVRGVAHVEEDSWHCLSH